MLMLVSPEKLCYSEKHISQATAGINSRMRKNSRILELFPEWKKFQNMCLDMPDVDFFIARRKESFLEKVKDRPIIARCRSSVRHCRHGRQIVWW